jgi:IMP dehydrogenase
MASIAQLLRFRVAQTAWATEAFASVYDASASWLAGHVGALSVAHKGRPAGIVTERDDAGKIVLMDRSSRHTQVFEIMSTRSATSPRSRRPTNAWR